MESVLYHEIDVGIDNNTEEERGKNKSIKDTKNYVKISNQENHGDAYKFTICQRDIGEKKRILTAALYNGTHNSIIY